ncbi:Glyoxalase/bleomycin resistance protein/dioxygenase [Beutenbergia cavernae DSM 12333]|uniref:Glyoxalase/bleomycin resistance protein/dioxygenase n=1 Tax=Beutenbergia cavernae (strain ATCC BAA-8 / DSM 12333 / CCUG 43141 / JCM 11478 / NBRC 16432 / NCIMB 13614 / HKI 0122) TaxID=471853 RepID=C5C393_BEUC1|nr:VOC family protein [Beutenbergia cavernae]ACQ79792.1 Glyoxalase/bleomycin resistance protein/dioxygenase [Beutenbergia cavernae DSM 12333]
MERRRPELAIAAISLDCADPRELAEFYRKLLGGTLLWDGAEAAAVRAGSVVLIAQRVADHRRPSWPGSSIVHLDLSSDDFDLAEQTAFALECGATRPDRQPDPRWTVLLDPAGHPFCLTPFTPA